MPQAKTFLTACILVPRLLSTIHIFYFLHPLDFSHYSDDIFSGSRQISEHLSLDVARGEVHVLVPGYMYKCVQVGARYPYLPGINVNTGTSRCLPDVDARFHGSRTGMHTLGTRYIFCKYPGTAGPVLSSNLILFFY